MNLRWKIAQMFESFWWRLYMLGKPDDEYLDWKRKYWRNFLEKAEVRIRAHDKLLDVGSGPAGIFLIFQKNEITAIEPLMKKYHRQIRFLQENSFPNVRFVEAPFEKFDANGTFDKVFCLNVINHVAGLDVCLDNLNRSLKEGGVLLLSADAHRWWFFKKLFRLIPWDILHPQQFSLREYEDKLESAGFYIVKTILLKKGLFFNYHLLIATK